LIEGTKARQKVVNKNKANFHLCINIRHVVHVTFRAKGLTISDMKYDVIIAGAGPTGLAMALALAGKTSGSPLNIAVIEARDPHIFATQGTDTRGTALTLATQSMMQALGIWDALRDHAENMRDILVTDDTGTLSDRPALLSFATESDGRASAAMVENRKLASALLDAVSQSPNISLLANTPIAKVAVTSAKAIVTTANETHEAPLIVAADGRNSLVRESAGITVSNRSLGQSALAFTITHEKPHNGLAQEHFLRGGGVFAVLPLPGHASSIVWAMPDAETKRLVALDDTAFNIELADIMGNRLGAVQLQGKRSAYPLQVHQARQLVGPRVALVGDAAHAIHPLAGLGLNLGFKDAAFLADVLLNAFRLGEDIGNLAVLERYAATRRFDIMSVALAMDGMNSLFASTNPAIGTVRRMGLKAVNRTPLLKSFFTAQAAGKLGALPRLMMGLPAG
jgi:2-octaprenyl-6-methoxyphenol hydroxylase